MGGRKLAAVRALAPPREGRRVVVEDLEPDAEIIHLRPASESARAGLSDLYDAHAHDIKRLAYLMTGDMALAEDLGQEAFVRVIGRLGQLRDPEAFGPYLRRTLVNLVKAHYRRRRVERAHAPEVAGPSSPMEALDDADALRTALMQLPVKQRAALVLRFYADLPDEEMARVLRCAHATVRSLVSRGLATLRQEMGDERHG